MERSLLLSVLSSSFIAGIAGALVGHWLTNRREKKNRLQEQRIQYLVDAYRAFAKANHHPRLYEVADDLEQAIADVQLLGSPELIRLVQKFANDMGTRQEAELDDILVTIRKNLRAELGDIRDAKRFWNDWKRRQPWPS
jgi:hypothetical protein